MLERQSAYRRHHSTETALLRVVSDITSSADSGLVTLLGLLDLSSAFDNVDISILLRWLHSTFGITWLTLSGIESFLCDRTQQVSFNGSRSTTEKLSSGVPQGLVVGPLLFILYTAELFEIIRISGLMAYSYADDTQIYLSIATKRAQEAADDLSECVSCVDVWISNNCFKLNTDKTQVIWLGTRQQQLMNFNTNDIHLQSRSVPCLSVVNIIAVFIDCNLSCLIT